jgi:hypothetical protein
MLLIIEHLGDRVEDVFREIDLAIEKGEFGIDIDQNFRKFDLKKLGTVLDKTAKLTAVLVNHPDFH